MSSAVDERSDAVDPATTTATPSYPILAAPTDADVDEEPIIPSVQ